jgi:hypothetical protein
MIFTILRNGKMTILDEKAESSIYEPFIDKITNNNVGFVKDRFVEDFRNSLFLLIAAFLQYLKPSSAFFDSFIAIILVISYYSSSLSIV